MAYESDELITRIKRDCYLPTVQGQWTHAQILRLMWDLQVERLVPRLISHDATFCREQSSISLVAAQSLYDLPAYSMFEVIDGLWLVDSSNGLTEINQIDTPDLKFRYTTTTGTPTQYWFESKQVALNATPDAGAVATYPTMRTWIYRRPGRLVRLTADSVDPTTNPAAAATIQSINTGTGVITYTGNKPTTTFTASSVHDVYRPSTRRRVSTAITATASPSGTQQTFSLSAVASLQAGDIVCVQDESVYPVVPVEMYGDLIELTIRSMTRTQGDQQAYETQINEMSDAAVAKISALQNRAKSQPKRTTLRGSPFVGALGSGTKRMITE